MPLTGSCIPSGRLGIAAAAAAAVAILAGCRPHAPAVPAPPSQAQVVPSPQPTPQVPPPTPQAIPASDQPSGPPPAPPENATAGGPAPAAPTSNPSGPEALLTLPQLDQLLAPIALYPDPLIGLILPSVGDFSDLQAAAAYAAGGGDPAQAGGQPWSPSVQGLAHYPQVVRWMVDNEPWTTALGAAFQSDPSGVMNAIQDLRHRAQAAGTLVSTPQQQVLVENGQIEIVPTQPSVVYVPDYDADTIYFEQPPGFDPYSLYYWGPPFPMGPWLVFAVDWRGHALWRGDWYAYYGAHGGWGRPVDFAQVRFSAGAGPQRWNAAVRASRGPAFRPSAAPRPGPRPGGRSWGGPRRESRPPARRTEQRRERDDRDRR